MKLVSWNANGKFEKNFPTMFKEDSDIYDADIYVIQECTNPKISDSEDYIKLDNKYYWVKWVGDDKYPDYGLGIIAKKDVDMEVWDLDNKGLRYFIPVTVNDDFNLLAVWTNPDINTSKTPHYPKEITKYYEEHKNSGFFNKEMIICGDFNCDKRVLNNDHGKNVDEMIGKLSEIGLIDVYHEQHKEKEGEESIPTFYWQYNPEKPYHLDHVFAAARKVKDDLKIGKKDKWLKLSDHMPLIFEIKTCEKADFEYEYYLQQITNKHLKYLFDLEYLTEEFQLPGLGDNGLKSNKNIKSLKVDGLAYDKKTKSVVVLEYKKELNRKVLRQGRRYYKNFEEKFEHYNRKIKTSYTNQIEKLHEQIKAIEKDLDDDFELSISKVIIISPEFSDAQIEYSKNPKYPYELYTVSLCEINERLSHVLYKKINHSSEEQDNKELYVSSEDLKITRCSLLENKPAEIKELYCKLENRLFEKFDNNFILDMRYIVDAVSIKAQSEYICLVNVKNSIKIHYYTEKSEKWDKYADEVKIRDISCISTGGVTVNYELKLTPDNIECAIKLINEVYDKKMK